MADSLQNCTYMYPVRNYLFLWCYMYINVCNKRNSAEMESPWDGGTKVCSNGPGHITKVTAMPIYGKNLEKIFFSRTVRPMTLKPGKQHWVLERYWVCSNDDPGVTLIYFTARSNLVPYAFVWEKDKTMEFSETVVVYDVKVDIWS